MYNVMHLPDADCNWTSASCSSNLIDIYGWTSFGANICWGKLDEAQETILLYTKDIYSGNNKVNAKLG